MSSDDDSEENIALGRSWIYNLNKEELQAEARRRGLDSEGKVDELRARISNHLKMESFKAGTSKKDSNDETISLLKDQINLLLGQLKLQQSLSNSGTKTSSRAEILNQVRKWNTFFDEKNKDAVLFLERVNELREIYEISKEDLVIALPELFRGNTLLWYRNNHELWKSYDDFVKDFKRSFFPKQYDLQLEEQIRNRKQRPGETINEYITAIRTLIRRDGSFDPIQELERIYKNLLPEYKMYIRPQDYKNLSELQDKALEYENIQEEIRSREIYKTPRKQNYASINTGYNPSTACFRCKRSGHFRKNCTYPPRKFCSQCGKDGVWSSNCCVEPGNGLRAGANRGHSSQ